MAKAPIQFARRAAALVVLLVLVAGCSRGAKRPPRNTGETVVPVVTAQTGAVAPTTVLSGTIAPLQNVSITSTLSEPTDSVAVQEGDHVHKGEVLAQLNTADLRAQLASDVATAAADHAKSQQTYAQAGLTIDQNSNTVTSARAAVKQAQQTLATDQLTLKRDLELLKNGYIAQSQVDAVSTTVKNDQQAVQSAQVTVQNDVAQVKANGTTSTGLQGATVAAALADEQNALAQADGVRVSIAKATIVSPIDGVVVNRNLNPGEFPGTRQIFTLQQTDHVYAVLNGAASQIVGVKNGSTVTISADNVPGRTLRATVVGVLSAVTPGSTNFIVKAEIDNAANLLRPGMVVSGTASLPSANGIRVPVTAFLDTTNSTVQVVRDNKIATVKVTMLAEDAKNAIVTGLEDGETVVVNGQLGLADGQPVKTKAGNATTKSVAEK